MVFLPDTAEAAAALETLEEPSYPYGPDKELQ